MAELALAFIAAVSLGFSFFHYKMERAKRLMKSA